MKTAPASGRFLAILFVLAGDLASDARGQEETSIDELLARLASANFEAAEDSSLALAQRGSEGRLALEGYLSRSLAFQRALDRTRLDALLLQLGDEDYQRREEAQEAIEEIGWRALPSLRAVLAGATDLEVKIRLRVVIDALSMDRALRLQRQAEILAILALVRIGSELSVDSLASLLGGDDLDLALDADFALRAILLDGPAIEPLAARHCSRAGWTEWLDAREPSEPARFEVHEGLPAGVGFVGRAQSWWSGRALVSPVEFRETSLAPDAVGFRRECRDLPETPGSSDPREYCVELDRGEFQVRWAGEGHEQVLRSMDRGPGNAASYLVAPGVWPRANGEDLVRAQALKRLFVPHWIRGEPYLALEFFRLRYLGLDASSGGRFGFVLAIPAVPMDLRFGSVRLTIWSAGELVLAPETGEVRRYVYGGPYIGEELSPLSLGDGGVFTLEPKPLHGSQGAWYAAIQNE